MAWVDAKATIGLSCCRGLGKARHIQTVEVWIQCFSERGECELRKFGGESNPSDMLPKLGYHDALTRQCKRLGCHLAQSVGDQYRVATEQGCPHVQLVQHISLVRSCIALSCYERYTSTGHAAAGADFEEPLRPGLERPVRPRCCAGHAVFVRRARTQEAFHGRSILQLCVGFVAGAHACVSSFMSHFFCAFVHLNHDCVYVGGGECICVARRVASGAQHAAIVHTEVLLQPPHGDSDDRRCRPHGPRRLRSGCGSPLVAHAREGRQLIRLPMARRRLVRSAAGRTARGVCMLALPQAMCGTTRSRWCGCAPHGGESRPFRGR